MAANPQRRRTITDAAVACLGEHGARGLTHRAVDRQAGVPAGTTSNYFPTRAALVLGAAERIFELLAPDPARVKLINSNHHGVPAAMAYVEYVAERLLSSPHLTLALFELRLEAARNPAVADVLTPFLRSGLVADQTFHDTAGLLGGPQEVQLLHWAIDGLVLAALTTGMDGTNPTDAARELTRRLLPEGEATR